jgi:hypothetical protein
MRKVTMVVAVFTPSCQVSEYPNAGPATAHRTMSAHPSTNADGLPTHSAVRCAKTRNACRMCNLLPWAKSNGHATGGIHRACG